VAGTPTPCYPSAVVSDPAPSAVLVTGAAGVLGWPLSLALARGGRPVLMMVRRNRRRNARERVDALAAVEPDVAGRLRILVGELAEDGVLEARGLKRAQEQATAIVHCAGTSDPAVDRALAYRTNVDGTVAMLALARTLPHLRRFVHVSCTSVAGQHRGLWTEDMLLEGQAFDGAAGESKLVAERRVRASGLPFTIARPSQLIGPELGSANGVAHLLRLLLRIASLPAPLRRLPLAPLGSCARIDAVPVGWAAAATIALLDSDAAGGGTFHLNDPHAPTVRAFLERVCPSLGIAPPRADLPRRAASAFWAGPWAAPARSLADQALNLPPATIGAMATCAAVDPTRAERILRPLDLLPPRFESWIDGAVEYARTHLV
jgi:nucleoside-diphosphate-sugar epimerase